MNQKLCQQIEFLEQQLIKMGQMLEQKQQENHQLTHNLKQEQSQNYDLKQCLLSLQTEFQGLEQQTKEKIYELNREIHFQSEQYKQLYRSKGNTEQQQIATLLKELSEVRSENKKLKEYKNKIPMQSQSTSFHKTNINNSYIRRYSPQPLQRVNNLSFISPQEQKRVPSLPDVASTRNSVYNKSIVTAPNTIYNAQNIKRDKKSPLRSKYTELR